jgi:quaternary ammonium compound-resistance protein SugE
MNWITLIVAGFFEVGFTYCLGRTKDASGMSFYMWGSGFIVSTFFSMFLLARAVRTIPIGTAYPVWTGIGAVGTVLVGICFFKEPVSFGRMFFITTLIISIIGLKMI